MKIAERRKGGLIGSNGYGRSGCDRAAQLFVVAKESSFNYDTAQLFIVITAVLTNVKIIEACQSVFADG